MKNIYDVGIVGSGVAGTFAALRAVENHKKTKVIVFELGRPPAKRRRQLEGFLGCFPTGDGKIYTENKDILDIVDGRTVSANRRWLLSWLEQAGPITEIITKSPNKNVLQKIHDNGFNIDTYNYIQWKPESVHQLSKLIVEKTEKHKKLEFSFDNEVSRIYKKKDHFVISTTNGDYLCKKIIICAGRSGWRWTNQVYKDLGLETNDDFAEFGIRVECAAQYMKEFNKSHCKIYDDNLQIGPLCWNGTIIPEDHADLVTTSFRSNEQRWETDKVSFSLYSKQYFKDSACYQADRIGKLTFLLFNDRVGREKIKVIMKKESQISILPEYDWLLGTIDKVSNIIPQIVSRGYFSAPDICTMTSKIRIGSNLETELDGLFVAGESARIHGISGAAISGAIAMDSCCEK